jgi:predicted dehydrogenase
MGYRDQADARIVALCDSNRRRAAARAGAWGVGRVYGDYRDVLADPEVDLVELLVPHHLHADMTVAACQAGKHVSVQKPMALTVAEADRMIQAAEQAGVLLRVFENLYS